MLEPQNKKKKLPQTYTANPDTRGAYLHGQNEQNAAKKNRKIMGHHANRPKYQPLVWIWLCP